MAETSKSGGNGDDPAKQPEPIPPQQHGAEAPSEKQIAEYDNKAAAKNRERFIYRPFRYLVTEPVRRLVRVVDRHNGIVSAAATAAIAVLTYFLATYAYDQGVLTNRQLNIMQGQLDTMQADQRPWVYVTNAIIEEPGPTFTKAGMYISIRFTYKNAGHTPAKLALIFSEAHVVNNAEYVKPSFQACEVRRKKPREALVDGTAVFPNQDGTQRTYATIAPQNVARLKFETDATIVVTGCIDYLFPVGPEHHETRFFYELVRTGPNNAMLRIDPDNAPVGASAYGLAINPGIAGDAD